MQYDTILLDELSPDSSDFEHDGLVSARNALPVQSGWREIKGRSQLDSKGLNVGEIPICGYCASGVGYIGSSNHLWSVESDVMIDRSRGGVAYATVGDWNFTTFGPATIAAPDLTTIPLQFRSSGGVNFADLVTSVDRPAPRLVGVVRSVVVGANMTGGGAGVYAGAADGQQFAWSARNNAADWLVNGTNGAGFGFLKDSEGDITGLVCFAAYAIVFKAFGVFRLDYTGDSNGFRPDEIGSGGLGLSSITWARGAVKAGSEVFYFANAGPCVVYNGETCQLLGGSKVRRYLIDLLSDYGADPGTPIQGTYDPWLACVVWVVRPMGFDTNTRVLIVCEVKHGSFDAYTVRFSPNEGRWSTISPQNLVRGLYCSQGSGVAGRPLYPLQSLRMVEGQAFGAAVMKLSNFSIPLSPLPLTMRTKLWQARNAGEAPRRATLMGVRPMWRFNGTKPFVTIRVWASDDSTFDADDPTVWKATLLWTAVDDNGFFTNASLPVTAVYFQFEIQIDSPSSDFTLQELRALEVQYEVGTEEF